MALTKGTGPFGPRAAGVFNFLRDGPAHTLYFEDSPKRVRVVFHGETVADSRDVKLLHETGHVPVYYFPHSDVRRDLLEWTRHTTHCPFKGNASYWSVRVGDRVARNAVWSYRDPIDSAPPLAPYFALYWDKMDQWLEEDEEVAVHPRDPYHRIDVLDSSRRVVVRVHGTLVAESARPTILFEAGLPARYYLPAEDVRTGALRRSDTVTHCAYKGSASHWSVTAGRETVDDVVWCYPDPRPEVARIAGLFAFYDEKVDLEVDGDGVDRPATEFV